MQCIVEEARSELEKNSSICIRCVSVEENRRAAAANPNLNNLQVSFHLFGLVLYIESFSTAHRRFPQ